MRKYNLKSIMHNAWTLFRRMGGTFSEALRLAWNNAKVQNAAKAAAEITEETHTWAGWKTLGYEVRHESRALYQAVVHDPRTRSGKRTISFFGASQVQPIEA